MKGIPLSIPADTPPVQLGSGTLTGENPKLVVVTGVMEGLFRWIPLVHRPLSPMYHISSIWIVSHKIGTAKQTSRGIRTVNGTEADVGGVLTSIEAEGVRHTDEGEGVRRVVE